MKKKNAVNKSGFTLLELLVVVVIIGILASIALPQYQHSVDKAKFVQLKTAAKAIKDAQTRYMLINQEWTFNLSLLDIEIQGGEYKNLSSEKDKILFDWGDCHVSQGSARDGILCGLHTPHVRYRIFFSSNNKQCWAFDSGGNRALKLCESEMPNSTSVHYSGAGYCGAPCTVFTGY